MILLAQLTTYILALAGVVGCTLAGIMFLGGALNRARPRGHRIRRGVYAALCLCGIVASAGAGFVGIGAIMYLGQR